MRRGGGAAAASADNDDDDDDDDDDDSNDDSNSDGRLPPRSARHNPSRPSRKYATPLPSAPPPAALRGASVEQRMRGSRLTVVVVVVVAVVAIVEPEDGE